jgi:hypothetical protein
MTQVKGKVAQEQMLEDAKRSILASGEFRTAHDLAKLIRVHSHTLDQQLNAWKNRGEIFSIPGGTDGELFPVFAFDQNRDDLQVFEAIPQILQIFGDKLSRWVIAAWFIAASSYLDDQPPKDLLEEDPDWVIAAARDQIEEVCRG